MRLSHANNLYYPLASTIPANRRPFSISLALSEMVPIKLRRQIVFPSSLGNNVPGKEVMDKRPVNTLYHTNRKLSMEGKVSLHSLMMSIAPQ